MTQKTKEYLNRLYSNRNRRLIESYLLRLFKYDSINDQSSFNDKQKLNKYVFITKMENAGTFTDHGRLNINKTSEINEIIQLLNYLGNNIELEVVPPKFIFKSSVQSKDRLQDKTQEIQFTSDQSLEAISTKVGNCMNALSDFPAISNINDCICPQFDLNLEQVQESLINTQFSFALFVELLAWHTNLYYNYLACSFSSLENHDFLGLAPIDVSEELFLIAEQLITKAFGV